MKNISTELGEKQMELLDIKVTLGIISKIVE